MKQKLLSTRRRAEYLVMLDACSQIRSKSARSDSEPGSYGAKARTNYRAVR